MVRKDVKLEKCPFCGSKDVMLSKLNANKLMYFVKCTNCDCSPFYEETEEKVVEKWNTRFSAPIPKYNISEYVYDKLMGRLTGHIKYGSSAIEEAYNDGIFTAKQVVKSFYNERGNT